MPTSSGSNIYNMSGSGWAPWLTQTTLNGFTLTVAGTPPRPAAPVSPLAPIAPQATPVSPTFDPKIEANALYGKPMSLFAGGFARIGASPAPINGPHLNAGMVDFLVSLGLAVPVTGNRKIYTIYLDNEKWWSSVTGWDGSGALPGDSTFHAEVAAIEFRPGTLTQAVCSLETIKFPGDENAYRPQMILEIRGLPYARFMANTGKPVPYVACDIGDVTDGADPADGINIGYGWQLIAYSPWAGYTSSTAEYVGITDVAQAYLLKDNFTVVGLGQTITRTHKNIDLLQSDKLRLSDRGNVAPDFVFDRDSVIGDDEPIGIIRSGATSQRRELELIAIDPDQDYTGVPSLSKIPRDPFVISAAVGKETITSPLVINASTRQSLVTFVQQYEENARKKVSFSVLAVGFEIEPGDLFALSGTVADGIDGEVFKCTQTEHGANYVTAIEGEAILRCVAYVADLPDPYYGSVVLLLHCDGTAGSTTFVDRSSFAHEVTAVGNAQISTSVFPDGALVCDGTGDGLVTESNTTLADVGLSPTNTSPFTIECRATFNAINRTQILVAIDQGLNARFFRLKQNGDDELMFEWSNTNGATFDDNIATTGADLATGTEYPIAVDKDSTGTLRIFVDGVMFAKDTPAASVIAVTLAAISVGSSGLLAGSSFDGQIRAVRITRGISRYGDVTGDASFTPPIAPFADS